MATQEKQPHGGSLTRPEKGEVLNPHGRPKKLITQLKEIGYHKSQVEDTVNTMLTMSRKDLPWLWRWSRSIHSSNVGTQCGMHLCWPIQNTRRVCHTQNHKKRQLNPSSIHQGLHYPTMENIWFGSVYWSNGAYTWWEAHPLSHQLKM